MIHHLGDVPAFGSAEDEARFWDTHQLAPEMWAQAQRGDPALDRQLAGPVHVQVVDQSSHNTHTANFER